MRIALSVATLFGLVVFLSSCMFLFNLSLPEGVYVAGDWNNWVPTKADMMIFKDGIYEFTLPLASITFYPSEDDPSDHIGWYKVIFVGGANTVVSSSLPVWKEKVDGDSITIYASPNLMEDGLAVGVGDSEKETGVWYAAGDFNGWNLQAMTKAEGLFKLEVNYSGKAGDVIKYKVARSTNWKPYETQYDGKNYNARIGQDGMFTADKDFSKLVVYYDPKHSLLWMEAK